MTTREMTVTASETLARFVAELTWEAVPDHVRHAARRVLLDTLGAALGGTGSEESARVRAGIADVDRGDEATIWGTSERSSISGASLINGTMAHAIEMDDFGGCSHSGTVVIPAALALVERYRPIDGKALLLSIIAGYEVARRALQAVGAYRAHTQLGWHSTGTCGSFGSAAAAARLLTLDAETTAWALGLAGSYTGGTWAFIDDGAMSKRLHPGKAAQNGVVAAHLARSGFTGPTRIFEASWGGFISTYGAEESELSRLTDRIGDDYQILYTGFKPWASCRRAHGGINALLSLRDEHQLGADDVQRILVRASEFYARMVGNTDVETMLDSQMSLPYGLAVATVHGRADIQQYAPEVRSSAEVRSMLERVDVVADPDMPQEQEPLIELQLRDGRKVSRRIDRPWGAPDNPLDDAALTEKFRSLASLTLPSGQLDTLAETIWHVGELEDVSRIVELMRV